VNCGKTLKTCTLTHDDINSNSHLGFQKLTTITHSTVLTFLFGFLPFEGGIPTERNQ